jgi:hydroxypyruvate isomerase
MSGCRLAVRAEMVFLDLPFPDRVRRIADLGFEVEMWNWATKDVDALAGTGATAPGWTTTNCPSLPPPW